MCFYAAWDNYGITAFFDHFKSGDYGDNFLKAPPFYFIPVIVNRCLDLSRGV